MKKLLMAMLALVMMAGCSSETSKPAQVEKPQPKPAEFVTGRAAFQKLFIAARGWARDAQPYRLESMITDDSKGKEGKSAVWRASFGSPLQRGVKAYKEKNYLEAASNFDLATQADPKSGQAWHHMAQACSQNRTWLPRAVAAIERACALEPMNATYLKQAGRILALAGQTEPAILYYRKAIQWGGDDDMVRQALEELTRASTSSPAARRGLFGKAG